MASYLIVIGALAHIASSSSYIYKTLQGKTKPNRVTFLMWAILAFIIAAAAYSDGAGWAVAPVIMAGLAPFCIFLASFVNPNAYWKLGKLDYVCGALSILAIALWLITSNPILAIVLALIGDAVAAVPTIIKTYKYPETEHFGAYVGALLNNALVFLYVPMFTFSALAFPVYIVICNGTILFGIYRKRLGFNRGA
jgi:hypothetical protein